METVTGTFQIVMLGWNGIEYISQGKLTSAPRVVRVSMSTAVWRVMWRQPAMRAPFRGLDWPYSSLIFISPGISFSAMSMALRPHSARLMSAVDVNQGRENLQKHHITIFYLDDFKDTLLVEVVTYSVSSLRGYLGRQTMCLAYLSKPFRSSLQELEFSMTRYSVYSALLF